MSWLGGCRVRGAAHARACKAARVAGRGVTCNAIRLPKSELTGRLQGGTGVAAMELTAAYVWDMLHD